jgi:hypothetical protein
MGCRAGYWWNMSAPFYTKRNDHFSRVPFLARKFTFEK